LWIAVLSEQNATNKQTNKLQAILREVNTGLSGVKGGYCVLRFFLKKMQQTNKQTNSMV
jgi:hypothetical protein